MAFDGFTIHAIVKELNDKLIGGRFSKIMQPESDELDIVIKAQTGTFYLTLSANASLPIVTVSDVNPGKPNPNTAPNFCMLLRKHIGNGRILSITQPGLERAITFELEHFNEMGDLETKRLVIELMGKHSNIIFINSENTIIDSIKHISASVSSVREVLPGREYFIPRTVDKADPFAIKEVRLKDSLLTKENGENVSKAIYMGLTGFSPFLAEEIVYASGIDASKHVAELTEAEILHLSHQIMVYIDKARDNDYTYTICYHGEEPVDYSVFPISHVEAATYATFDSISSLLLAFYQEKETISRIRQKSQDLRRILQTNLERAVKKADLQRKQLKDTDKKDQYRLYGDLLSAYGYSLENGLKECTLENYNDENRPVRVPLDETLTPMENAKRYYDRYAKLKRTKEALDVQLAETEAEIDYLTSVRTLLDLTTDAANLNELKKELIASGYIKKSAQKGRKPGKGEREEKSKPYHYISSDGYDIFVGKNNLQNDDLSFRVADGGDLWFHAKGCPGSHVIVKLPAGQSFKSGNLPDRLFEEAASLAAYYSANRTAPKVEIDYLERRQLKKPPKANAGYVIYHTNYSMMAIPQDAAKLKLINE